MLAKLGRHLVIEERQEREASPPRSTRYGMEQRAGEDHSPAPWRLERARPVFGKADLAAVEILVEIDRHRKRRWAVSLVVLSRCARKMPTVLCRVAGYDVTLHTGNLELMDLQNLRDDAPQDACLTAAGFALTRLSGESFDALAGRPEKLEF